MALIFVYCCRAGDGVIARIFDVDLELLSYVLDKVKDLKSEILGSLGLIVGVRYSGNNVARGIHSPFIPAFSFQEEQGTNSHNVANVPSKGLALLHTCTQQTKEKSNMTVVAPSGMPSNLLASSSTIPKQ